MTNHLWESTLFAAVVALLTLGLRKNPARVRHWLWLAASIKFLIPFSLLVALGSHLGFTRRPSAAPSFSYMIEEFHLQLTAPEVHFASRVSSPRPIDWTAVAGAVWISGCAVVLFAWFLRWRRVDSAARAASPVRLPGLPMAAMASPALLEPGVFGILRPVLLLPEGIAERLSEEQLDAIVAHELCHVRRRDNLASAIHMVVEAVFWFHPLVWWIGARMVEERERACDEEVLGMGKAPEVYAESILKVCRFYLESPLECVAGVTGSDLKKRVENIMTRGAACGLGFGKKLLLAVAGILTVAGPIAVGVLNTPQMRAQAKPQFEEASIKPSDPNVQGFRLRVDPGGRIVAVGATLEILIQWAYDVRDFQIQGGPSWRGSGRYDIATVAEGGTKPGDLKPMMQALLADRFKLAFHRDTKELPVYALIVGRGGPKLHASASDGDGPRMNMGRGQIEALKWTMPKFAADLARQLGRPVIDRTELVGNYDFKVQWTPDETMTEPSGDRPVSAAIPGPSIFTALQEQLGLRLESTRGPVEILAIDHAQRPSEN